MLSSKPWVEQGTYFEGSDGTISLLKSYNNVKQYIILSVGYSLTNNGYATVANKSNASVRIRRFSQYGIGSPWLVKGYAAF